MIRLSLLALFVLFLCVYAWRDWFVSLCGLILLTVLSQHHDMPEGIGGIPGLKVWNMVFAMTVLACIAKERRTLTKLPARLVMMILGYVGVLVIGGGRALFDLDVIALRSYRYTYVSLFFDLIANPLKYVSVGVLMYVGCRSRRRVWLAIQTLLLFGFLHALMMYKTMKGTIFTGNYEDARRMTDKMIGLHANDLAGLLTFCLWGCIILAIKTTGKWRWLAVAAAVAVIPTIVGCHSRSAYLANIVLALTLGVVRWRRLLVLFPAVAFAGVLIFPQIVTRLTMGFDETADVAGGGQDWNAVTAGRTLNLWEPTIGQIMQSPVWGHGRFAIYRSEVYYVILEREGQVPSHPHNSYLEFLLDSGIVGLVMGIGPFVAIGMIALGLFRSSGDPLIEIVGGVALVAVINAMALSMSSNFLYPKESMLWLFGSCGMVLRVWALRQGRAAWRTTPARPDLGSVAGRSFSGQPPRVQRPLLRL